MIEKGRNYRKSRKDEKAHERWLAKAERCLTKKTRLDAAMAKSSHVETVTVGDDLANFATHQGEPFDGISSPRARIVKSPNDSYKLIKDIKKAVLFRKKPYGGRERRPKTRNIVHIIVAHDHSTPCKDSLPRDIFLPNAIIERTFLGTEVDPWSGREVNKYDMKIIEIYNLRKIRASSR